MKQEINPKFWNIKRYGSSQLGQRTEAIFNSKVHYFAFLDEISTIRSQNWEILLKSTN